MKTMKTNPYLFDCLVHHVAHHTDVFALPHAEYPADGLVFYGGVPLGLEDVDSACDGEVVEAFEVLVCFHT